MVTNDDKKIEELLKGHLEAQEEQMFLRKIEGDPKLQKNLDEKIEEFESRQLEELTDIYFEEYFQKTEDEISEEAKQAAQRIKPQIFSKLGLFESSGFSFKIYEHGVEFIKTVKNFCDLPTKIAEFKKFCEFAIPDLVFQGEEGTITKTEDYQLPDDIGSLAIGKTEQGNKLIFTLNNIWYPDYELILKAENKTYQEPVDQDSKQAIFENIPAGSYNVYLKRDYMEEKYIFQFSISKNERNE